MNRVSSKIRIFGTLTPSLMTGLTAAVLQDNATAEYDGPTITETTLAEEVERVNGNASLQFATELQPDGAYSATEEFCVANNIGLRRFSEPGFNNNGELRVFFPGMKVPEVAFASCEEEPVVALCGLKQALQSEKTLADVVALYETFEREIPPLVLA